MSKDGLAHIRVVHEQVAGRWVRSAHVMCSDCRKEKPYSRLPKDAGAKWLTQRGWVDPGDPRKAVCPDCAVARTTSFLAAVKPKPRPLPIPNAVVVTVLPPAPDGPFLSSNEESPMAVTAKAAEAALMAEVKADAPRAAKPADNRRIADELEAHYDTDRLCYRGIASDLMIAGKLDVPRAWVADVREKMYGPDVPEAMRDAPARLAEFDAEFKALEDRGLTLAADAEAAQKRLAAYLKSLDGAAK